MIRLATLVETCNAMSDDERRRAIDYLVTRYAPPATAGDGLVDLAKPRLT